MSQPSATPFVCPLQLGYHAGRSRAEREVPEEREAAARKRCAVCGIPLADVKQCGGCRKVAYCSRECQRKHWPQHKEECRRLQAARGL
jgi:hypothetical protein